MNPSAEQSPAGAPTKSGAPQALNEFFSATEAGIDRWRSLHRITRALAAADGNSRDKLRTQARAALAELAPLEELNGYPGPHLMGVLGERLNGGDWTALARLTQKISGALLANSYRDDASAWSDEEDGEGGMAEAILPPTLGRGQSRKPYR